jgi:hypothetical protein
MVLCLTVMLLACAGRWILSAFSLPGGVSEVDGSNGPMRYVRCGRDCARREAKAYRTRNRGVMLSFRLTRAMPALFNMVKRGNPELLPDVVLAARFSASDFSQRETRRHRVRSRCTQSFRRSIGPVLVLIRLGAQTCTGGLRYLPQLGRGKAIIALFEFGHSQTPLNADCS